MASISLKSGLSDKERVGKARSENIASAILQDPPILEKILLEIRTTNFTYAQIARRCLNGHAKEGDTDEVLRSGISQVAVLHLPEMERQDHTERVRHSLSKEDCRRGSEVAKTNGNGKTTFNRKEQIRSAIKRGQHPWSDAEENMLLAFAMDPTLQREWNDGRVVQNWKEIHERMQQIFPDFVSTFRTTRGHFHNIMLRHERGQYSRGGLPSSPTEAITRALDSLIESDASINPDNEVTASQIGHLLMNQSDL